MDFVSDEEDEEKGKIHYRVNKKASIERKKQKEVHYIPFHLLIFKRNNEQSGPKKCKN
jgi:hypothetical protein